nr:unnamed protein product [Spirometra erinaceieuropaei]
MTTTTTMTPSQSLQRPPPTPTTGEDPPDTSSATTLANGSEDPIPTSPYCYRILTSRIGLVGHLPIYCTGAGELSLEPRFSLTEPAALLSISHTAHAHPGSCGTV